MAMGLFSGLIIVRLLPSKEYAYYTIANSVLGTLTILADSGISAGVLSEGGKVSSDRDKLGRVVATGLSLRLKFSIISLVLGIPILIVLLRQHDASWFVCIFIAAALIPAFVSGLSDSLLEIVPKLHQEVRSLQANAIGVGLGRLALTASLLVFVPFAGFALFAGGLPRIIGNIRLRSIASAHASLNAAPSIAVRSQILSMVRRLLPGAVYYCFAGQITIWLLTVMGTTTSVAELGALGRIAILSSLVTAVASILVYPKFARSDTASVSLQRQAFQSIIFVIGMLTCLIVLIDLISSSVLMMLGPEYTSLDRELRLSMIGSGFGVCAGTFFGLFTSRGWTMRPSLSIGLNFLTILAGLLIFDVSCLVGVLWFNIFVGLANATVNGAFLFLKIATSAK